MFDLMEEKFQTTFFAMPDQGDESTSSDDDSGSGDDTDGGFE